MKLALAGIAGLALAGAASAQNLTTIVTDDAVQTAFTAAGGENVRKVSGAGEEPIWVGEFGDENFYANAVACQDGYVDCQGLRLVAIYPYPESTTDQSSFLKRANEIYAAVKVVSFDEQNFLINYYIILNGGVTQENLNETMRVYVDLVGRTVERLFSAEDE